MRGKGRLGGTDVGKKKCKRNETRRQSDMMRREKKKKERAGDVLGGTKCQRNIFIL